MTSKVKALFDSLNVKYTSIELNTLENGSELQQALATKTNKKTVPQVFIRGTLIGGCDDTLSAHEQGTLQKMLNDVNATLPPNAEELNKTISSYIDNNKVVIFSKSTCPFCRKVKALFSSLGVQYTSIELDQIQHGAELQKTLATRTNRSTVPQVFIRGVFYGGCDDTMAAHERGALQDMLEDHPYEYDLVVIGGGSGGLSASKKAAQLGRKVAVLDFVEPTPLGTTWGLGGTCVNVGCIPKKLMHTAGLIGQLLKDANYYGWRTIDDQDLELNKTIKHNWMKMIEEIQNHIKSLNFGYRVQLREEKVTYLNSYGSFIDSHTLKTVDKKGQIKNITANKFIIATGERPRYPNDCEGAREYSITSDDLFSLPYCPGKTLVVGASYVALECAGFLRGLGLDVTVMVRSILLRGFDQEMAEKVGEYMKEEGVKFIRPCVPIKVEQLKAGEPGRLRVTGKKGDGEIVVDEYNTVMFAIGRDACTDRIGLENVGVYRNPKTGKIPSVNEQTNVPHIYAIGDILEGKPELTPVAIEAGMLLARRLFSNSTIQCDYLNVPTTVFTPLEYGACGYAEEDAIKKFGADNIEVYIQNFVPLEWTIAHRPVNACYAKLICLSNEKERAIGFHYLGPNAGEVTQLVGIILKKNCTKADFDALIGIHPTCAEVSFYTY
ncbi:Thioredoxin reductase 1: cytoplasmic-like protein [Dinothrombium tinctorium]|uniref:thioredoxin-disulfide reductase (NADPH) n=1 Tax=Dinothrombium tinctorium TaxID=1965070 RepID=A0A3S3P535_9ACAR|nr:Thioredoxin reductase 1: cytoplasmic-like protein [Dinothrombium tinctorium]RWS08217.1 Thioredoxin reductase 1: cytoplasmic-like protein [Dinothrombium tinctorium]